MPAPSPTLFLAAAVLLAAIATGFGVARLGARRSRRHSRRRVATLERELARFLDSKSTARALRRAVRSADPSAFWAALETLSLGLGRAERARLSGALERNPFAAAERRALEDDSPWRAELAARRLSLLRSPASRRALRRTLARGPEVVSLAAAMALARDRDARALRWIVDHPETLRRRRSSRPNGLAPGVREGSAAGAGRVPATRGWRRMVRALGHRSPRPRSLSSGGRGDRAAAPAPRHGGARRISSGPGMARRRRQHGVHSGRPGGRGVAGAGPGRSGARPNRRLDGPRSACLGAHRPCVVGAPPRRLRPAVAGTRGDRSPEPRRRPLARSLRARDGSRGARGRARAAGRVSTPGRTPSGPGLRDRAREALLAMLPAFPPRRALSTHDRTRPVSISHLPGPQRRGARRLGAAPVRQACPPRDAFPTRRGAGEPRATSASGRRSRAAGSRA